MSNYMAQHIRRREKKLVCDYVDLNDFDIKVLLTDAAYSCEFIAQLVLSSLLTGRTVETIIDSIDLINTSHKYGLAVLPSTVKYPQGNVLPETEKYVTKSTHAPFAVLPVKVSDILTGYALSDSDKIDVNELAKAYLHTLNSNYGSRLTLARISTYIDSEAYQFGISDAELVWVKGQKLKVHGGASYLQVKSSELANKLLNFIRASYAKANMQVDDIKSDFVNSDNLIGSSLQINQEVLKAHISDIKYCIEKIKNTKPLNAVALHNYFTYYTLLILNISTGHRPRKEAYRKIDFFDLITGTVLIFDKENRGPGTSRVIPLTDTAKQQLENYLSHLRHLKVWFHYEKPTISRQIEQVINNQRSLFNLIVYSRSNFKFRLATLENIEKTVPEKLNLKSNWHRHWLRSKLAKCEDLSMSVINYFMGHENKLDETFSRFSCLAFSDVNSLKGVLQDFADDVNATPLRGLER